MVEVFSIASPSSPPKKSYILQNHDQKRRNAESQYNHYLFTKVVRDWKKQSTQIFVSLTSVQVQYTSNTVQLFGVTNGVQRQIADMFIEHDYRKI